MAGHDDVTGDLGASRGRTATGPGGRPGRVVVKDLLPPGELVDGRYRVEAPLGQGGMGAVYRARDVTAGRDVALKVLLTAEGNRVGRFEREAELLARLDRVPGVVHVHARGLHRGLSWLAMDLVEGHDLERPLSRGPLPVEQALELVESVARTVHACHALGLVHRDLKPSNVLLGREGPRVVDFGLARGGAEARFTATGEIVGTPSFMAPEQVDGGFDARTDVWALGAILHTATTGALVVEASNLLELVHVLKNVDPTPPSALVPGLPPGLDVVVRGALQRDPAARYPTAEALADDCARLRRGEPPLGSGARAPRPHARRARVAAGLGLLAVALAAGVAGGARRLAQLAARREAAQAQVPAERAWVAGGQGGWDLGAGPGPAPTVEGLGARLAGLGPAAGAEAEAARAELEELRRRLEGRVGGADSPLGHAVDASIAAARSDLQAAVRLAERAVAHPAGLRLRARLWRPVLAGARDAGPWRALRTWLDAVPEGDAARGLAEEAARAGLVLAVEGVVRGAPADPDAAATLDAVTRAAGDALRLDAAAVSSLAAPAKLQALDDSALDWVAAGAAATDAGLPAFGRRLVELVRTAPEVPCPPRLRGAQERLLDARLRAWAGAPAGRRREALGLALAELDLTLLDGVEPNRGPATELLLRVHKELVTAGHDDAPVVRLLGLRADAQDLDRVARKLGDEGVLELRRRWPRLRMTRLLPLVLDLERRPALRGDPRLDDYDRLLRERQLDLSYATWARSVAHCARAIAAATSEQRTPAERAWILELTPGARHAYSPDSAAALEGWRLEAEVLPDAAAFREVLSRGLVDLRKRAATVDPVGGLPALQRLLVQPVLRLPPWDDPRPPPDRAFLEWARECGREATQLASTARIDGVSASMAWVLALRAGRLLGTAEALAEAEAVWARRPPVADRVAVSVEWVLLPRARGDLVEARRRLAAERERLAKGPDATALDRLEQALRD